MCILAREEWQAGIDETFQKIRAVHNINEEIIATVEATQEAISFRYAIAHTTEGLVDLKETPVKLKGALKAFFARVSAGLNSVDTP